MTSSQAQRAAPGLQADFIKFQLALYYLSPPESESQAAAKAFIAREAPAFTLVDELSGEPKRPEISLALLTAGIKEKYAPQDPESLKYFGRGLSAGQANQLQNSPAVLIVNFGFPAKDSLQLGKNALEILAGLAGRCDCLLWDEETRETYSLEAWRDQRLEGWAGGLPAIRQHVIVHAYVAGDNGLVRAISLGMAKFGLPDIAVNDLDVSSARGAVSMLNVLMQRMLEGATMDAGGVIAIGAKDIRHPLEHKALVDSLNPGAKDHVRIKLRPAQPQQGDPNNLILEVDFSEYPGQSLQEKQHALLGDLFGVKDDISLVEHNEAILAASDRAKAKLPELKKQFGENGVKDALLMLKAPFATPDGGTEWMWVEVLSWKDETITGVLQNKPQFIPDLKSGARVTISQDEVFDYILTYNDGRSEGNETGALILKFQQANSP